MPFLSQIIAKISSIIDPANTEVTGLEIFFKEDINWLLQKAILCGEYHNSIEVINFTIQLGKLQLQLTTLQQQNNAKWKGQDVKGLIDSLQNAQRNFSALFNDLSNRVNNNLKQILLGEPLERIPLERLKGFYWINEVDIKFHANLLIHEQTIFKINVLLAYLDEYPECDKEKLSELDAIELFLKEILNEGNDLIDEKKEVIKILIDKVNFLKFKLEYRHKHPQESFENDPSVSIPDLGNNCYEEFYKKAIEHYVPVTNLQSRHQHRIINAALKLPFKDLRLEPFHHIKKYIYRKKDDKELKKSLEAGEQYLQYLNDSLSNIESGSTHTNGDGLIPFNQLSFQSAKNFLSNLIYGTRLRLEQKNKFITIKRSIASYIAGNTPEKIPDKEFLAEFYSELTKFASKKNSLKDYYCFTLFLDFLDEMIKDLKLNPSVIIELGTKEREDTSLEAKRKLVDNMIKYLKQTYERTLVSLKVNLEQSMSYKALPIYLTWEECRISYQWINVSDQDEKLFLHSSYILPFNFPKIASKLASWDSLLRTQENGLRDIFDVAIAHHNILNQFKEFDKKVKENEFKTVQIIAMFVSIAAFVLTSVKIFENKSGLESFGIIIGLAGCFVLFNIFFYIIIISQYKSFKNAGLTILKFIAFLIFPVALCCGSYSILNTEHSQNEKYLRDSTVSLKKYGSLQEKVDKDSIALHEVEEKLKRAKIK